MPGAGVIFAIGALVTLAVIAAAYLVGHVDSPNVPDDDDRD